MKQNVKHKSSQKSDNNSPAHKLTLPPINAYPVRVDSKSRQTAKFRDSNPLTWRQHRHHDAGGFFTSVGCASGFMSGMRGLQNGNNRNKRVLFQVQDLSTRQLLPNQKPKLGAVIMTAITQGNIAHNSLARVPHVPFTPALPKHKAAPATIVFNKSRTGYIAYSKGTPLAWLVVGYHQGQLNNQPKRVEFVDVAWHRQHERGISMETAFFDTLTEAMQFIRTTFGKVGAA
jgi:hypothetical protein